MMRAILLLALLAALGTSVWYNRRLAGEIEARDADLAEKTEHLHKLESDLQGADARRREELRAQQELVTRLEQGLSVRKAAFDEVERRWRIANNRGGPSDPTAELRDQIGKQKQILDDLNEQINEVKAEQTDDGSRSRIYENQQRLAAGLSRSDLDARIQAEARSLQAMLDQQSQLRQQGDAASRAQARQLDPQIRRQRIVVQAFKDQRRGVDQQYGQQAAAERIQAESKQMGYRASLAQLGQRLRDERENYQQLLKQLQEAKGERTSSKAELDRLNADFAAKRQELQSAQQALAEARAKLSDLQK